MNIAVYRNIVLGAIVLSIALLAATVICSQRSQGAGRTARPAEKTRLAADAEMAVKGYKYQESNQTFQLQVTGASIVHRGRPLLGLRSNLVKAMFFQDVQGRYKTSRGTLAFSASSAEWDADPARPFALKKGISLTLNGRKILAKRAMIYFNQRILQVDGTGRETFNL